MNTFSTGPKTVAICETQPVTAAGLRAVLGGSPNLLFLKATNALPAGTELLRSTPPDVLLLDKSFGTQVVMDWLAESRSLLAGTSVVVWGTSITEPEALRLLQAGVRGIVRKTAASELMIECLTAVASGANWMEESLFGDSQRMERYPRSELTPREHQVLELVEQGMKNKDIARNLGIRPGTVKIHLKHIFEKTGVRGRYGLALTGLKEKGMLELSRA
ncbi:MAG: response regulator transcription factor [Bryobacterales bacterium]|nr:response regulator transcription factor [Bryobacterales bacterium]